MTIALITGGTRGIGNHLVRGFLTAGYRVIFTATDASKASAHAQKLAQELGIEHGDHVHGEGVDVTDPNAIDALFTRVREIEAETGDDLGVLINNAGVIEAPEGPVWDVPPEQLERTITTNVLGPFYMIRAFAPHLLAKAEAHKPARIIDINSGSGSHGTPQYAAYSASKVALFRLADSVHHYGYDKGLRIFELAPGVIRSDMTTSMPVHDWRGDDDWTKPQDVIDLALGFAFGELDAFSGRFARAGHDTVESLKAMNLTEDHRRLRLTL